MSTDESARLARLHEYQVLDTPPERNFDQLAELAAELFDVPIATIALTDATRQYFKSRIGLAVAEVPRANTFCDRVVAQRDVLVEADAVEDSHLRFSAGAPLIVAGGECLGALCIHSPEPRTFSDKQKSALRSLAQQVVSQLELRRLISLRAADTISAREALQRADRLALVGQMAAGVAHELGTPLAVVAGRARLMLASNIPQDQWPTHAKIISEQADRMTVIIQQMLDLARRREPRKTQVDLRSVARQTAVMLLTEAKAREITLTYENDETSRPAELDPSQMVQVASNLVVNALQACARGKHVRISTGAIDRAPPPEIGGPVRPCVFLRVEDEGDGIPPEHLQRVFEPFFTTKKTREGTGLGLPVAWSITRDHDGWIEVESEPQQGSRFTVYVPQAPAPH